MGYLQFWMITGFAVTCWLASAGALASIDKENRFEFWFYGTLAVLFIPIGFGLIFRAIELYIL